MLSLYYYHIILFMILFHSCRLRNKILQSWFIECKRQTPGCCPLTPKRCQQLCFIAFSDKLIIWDYIASNLDILPTMVTNVYTRNARFGQKGTLHRHSDHTSFEFLLKYFLIIFFSPKYVIILLIFNCLSVILFWRLNFFDYFNEKVILYGCYMMGTGRNYRLGYCIEKHFYCESTIKFK